MAAFSKRHYVAIAETIAKLQEDQTLFTRYELARFVAALVKQFEQDNRAFMADRFVVACGFDPDRLREALLVPKPAKPRRVRRTRSTDNAS